MHAAHAEPIDEVVRNIFKALHTFIEDARSNLIFFLAAIAQAWQPTHLSTLTMIPNLDMAISSLKRSFFFIGLYDLDAHIVAARITGDRIPVLARNHHLRFLIASPAILSVNHAGLAENRHTHPGAHLRGSVGRNHPNTITFLETAVLSILGMHIDDGFGFQFEQIRLIASGFECVIYGRRVPLMSLSG